jgi:heme-degrading monooxygenase HmoA
MILEVAHLHIKPNRSASFEKAFDQAAPIIRSMKGYIRHSLQKCIEQENHYLLMVEWETLHDHEIGFRKSDEYQEWKALLHSFYDPFPEVLHFH